MKSVEAKEVLLAQQKADAQRAMTPEVQEFAQPPEPAISREARPLASDGSQSIDPSPPANNRDPQHEPRFLEDF